MSGYEKLWLNSDRVIQCDSIVACTLNDRSTWQTRENAQSKKCAE